MTVTMSQMGQDPKFARFLAATIGHDVRGEAVSVLSMLARLDLDPWREAADLAAMPDSTARKRLDILMTRFTDVPSLGSERGKIISALLGFLPRRPSLAMSSVPGVSDQEPVLPINAQFSWGIVAVVALGLLVMLMRG